MECKNTSILLFPTRFFFLFSFCRLGVNFHVQVISVTYVHGCIVPSLQFSKDLHFMAMEFLNFMALSLWHHMESVVRNQFLWNRKFQVIKLYNMRMGKFNTVTFIKTFRAKVVFVYAWVLCWLKRFFLKIFIHSFPNFGIIRKFKRTYFLMAAKKQHNFLRQVDLTNTVLNFPLFTTSQ